MAQVTGQSLAALIQLVMKTPGFSVTEMGPRWKIINQDGGRTLFLARRPPSNNTLKKVYDSLASIGWTEDLAAEFDEEARQRRLDEDRRRNEEKLEMALREASLTDERAAANKQSAAAMARLATSLGYGHQKAVMPIDAGFARDLLEHNRFFVPGRSDRAPVGRCNRPFDKGLRDHYAGQMLRGEWKLTHQGIALDVDGVLVDGQHRLAALVKAAEIDPKVSFVTEITYDLPADTMAVIDTGKSRSAADLLAFEGEANRVVLASAIRLCWIYDTYGPDTAWKQRISRAQMTDYLKGNPELRGAVRLGVSVGRVTTPSSAAAFAYLAGRVYRDAPLDEFFYGIRTGYELPEGDPRGAFRDFNARLKKSAARNRSDRVEQLALLIKTWNKWLQGLTAKNVKWAINEEFPRPIERD